MPKDDQTELFYLVDNQDQLLGSISRAEAHRDQTKIHRSVQILLTNQDGEVLLQKRSLSKDKHPGKWTVSASGHVTYGQTYEEAAERELQEELGVTCQLSFHSKSLNIGETEQEYAAIFTGKIAFTPRNFDQDEVSEVKWCNRKELNRLYVNKKLTFTGATTLKVLGYLDQ